MVSGIPQLFVTKKSLYTLADELFGSYEIINLQGESAAWNCRTIHLTIGINLWQLGCMWGGKDYQNSLLKCQFFKMPKITQKNSKVHHLRYHLILLDMQKTVKIGEPINLTL